MLERQTKLREAKLLAKRRRERDEKREWRAAVREESLSAAT